MFIAFVLPWGSLTGKGCFGWQCVMVNIGKVLEVEDEGEEDILPTFSLLKFKKLIK